MSVDLASRSVGGSVVAASDESFGFKEYLIEPSEPAFVPGTYDLRGEVVDGWETRRHTGGDWAIVRLGVGGRLHAIDVDTRFFTGNHPTGCRIDACVLDPVAEATAATVPWTTVVETVALKSDSHNVFAVDDPRRYTHVRLHLESDGGVARLRVYGDVIADPVLWAGVTVEVSGVEQGGRVEWSSDDFYSDASALIAPDRPRTMGDGWRPGAAETSVQTPTTRRSSRSRCPQIWRVSRSTPAVSCSTPREKWRCSAPGPGRLTDTRRSTSRCWPAPVSQPTPGRCSW
jgi:allantoicase